MNKLRRILVVDGSRVVRATLTKHLKDDFEVCEETNGESAWQSLVLDPAIVAVISSLHAPQLASQGLLQRLRASPLHRLKGLPFLLIASESEKRTEPTADNTSDIAGFITKTMQKAEIVERLRAVLEPGSAIDSEGHSLPEICEKVLPTLVAPATSEPTLLSRDQIENRIAHALSTANRQATGVCALMFGIVNHDALIDQFGEDIAEEIGLRFANLLLTKIGRYDCIARYSGERLVIVSRGADLAQCTHFATRVCKSLASGQIAIRGQQVRLRATAGAATSLEQGAGSSRDLLALASRRLDRALVCGGKAVITDSQPECPLHNSGVLLSKMLASLTASDEQAIAARIGTFGLQILPVLKIMNHELSLGLQLPEIKRQLQQRASAENGAAAVNQTA